MILTFKDSKILQELNRLDVQNTSDVIKKILEKEVAFPNLSLFCNLAATLPVSSAIAERSFSKMKQVKTYLRAKTGDGSLSHLCLLSSERELGT